MGVRKIVLCITFFATLDTCLAGKHDIYKGYSVHGIQLQNTSHMRFLHELELKFNLSWWQYGVPAVRDALVAVSPENRIRFLDNLEAAGLNHYLYEADVAKLLEKRDGEVATWKQNRSNRLVPFEDYPRYIEVDAYMERLAAQYPNLVTVVNAGPSFEGRAIKYLKISTTNFTDTSKPIYFMDAMLHATEWVTTPVTLYAAHRLVEDLRDGDKDLLDKMDWIILPLANPDGYEYSHTNERLWRKTRSYYPSVSTTCYGVDANRNFDFSWNTLGVSDDPCSNNYPGPEAFSEPESRYVRNILREYQGRIQLYLDIHSYGNLILFGYGNNSLPSNAAHIHYVGSVMGAAIDTTKLQDIPHYLVGNSGLVLYPTSGTAQDYGQLLSFAISATVLLTFAAKRGLLRAGGTRSPLLVPPASILKEKAPELTPLAASN